MKTMTLGETPNEAVLQDMRKLACQGASVRSLLAPIGVSLEPRNTLLVFWYFKHAFLLTLGEVLPLREWLGTDRDTEIDAELLPLIEKAKEKWMPTIKEQVAV